MTVPQNFAYISYGKQNKIDTVRFRIKLLDIFSIPLLREMILESTTSCTLICIQQLNTVENSDKFVALIVHLTNVLSNGRMRHTNLSVSFVVLFDTNSSALNYLRYVEIIPLVFFSKFFEFILCFCFVCLFNYLFYSQCIVKRK